jgi:hypothetical protein
MNRTLQNYLLFSCATLIVSTLYTAISWELTSTGAIGTDSTKRYTYNPALPINYEAFSGPLHYVDTNTAVEWITNIQTSPYLALGEFFWRAGEKEWHYNAMTREWSLLNNKLAWFHSIEFDTSHNTFTQHVWSHNAKNDMWIFKSLNALEEFNHYWEHHIKREPISFDDNPIFIEQWGYNSTTNQWRNITRNKYEQNNNWELDQETMRWSRSNTSESWVCDAAFETYELTGENISRNRWRHLDKNRWLEEAEGIEWEYEKPLAIRQLSTWRNTITGEIWSFDEGSQKWFSTQPGRGPKYFPPLVPPMFALQVEKIVETYDSLDTAISENTTLAGECIITDNNHILKTYTDGSFNLSIPALSAHVGGGQHYAYTENFETSLGEKWQKTDALSFNLISDTRYMNVSNTVSITHIVSHNSSLGEWSLAGSELKWKYDSSTNIWHEARLNLDFSFNIDTLIWKNMITQTEWIYIFNATLGTWTWRNLTAQEDWILAEAMPAEKTRGKSHGFTVWKNINTNQAWFPFINYGLPEHPPIFIEATDSINFDTAAIWSYNPTTHLWHVAQSPSTNGLDLFPCLPGNIAGCIEFIKNMGRTDTTSTSPLSEEIGIHNRITQAQQQQRAAEQSMQTILQSNEGSTLHQELLPLLASQSELAKKTRMLCDEYRRQTNPLNEIGSAFTPLANEGYSHWEHLVWKFDTAGKGALTCSLTRPLGCKIGFAPTPTSDATATYSLKISLEQSSTLSADFPDDPDATSYYTIYLITLLKGDLEITTQGRPLLHTGTTLQESYMLWCTYDNGHIRMGTGDPLAALRSGNGISLLFDYRISDGPIPETIQYFSFADVYSEFGGIDPITFVTYHNTGPITGITSHNYTLFSSQVAAVDLLNTCQDYVRLIPFELAWKQLKTQLNTLATFGLTYKEKSDKSKELFDNVLARRTMVPPNGLSTQSQAYNDYLFSGLLFGGATLKVFNDYTTQRLYTYDDSITALLTASQKALSAEDKQALFDTASEAILQFTIFAQNDTFAALENDFTEISGNQRNEDFNIYKTFIHEENDVLQCMNEGLLILGPPMLERFFGEIPVTIGDPYLDPFQAPLDELKAAESQAQVETKHALIQRVVDGISTPFSAITALAMLFFIESNFDNIRLTINDYIADKGYDNFHHISSTGTPLRSHTYLYTLFTQIITDLAPLLKTTGNSFTPPFQGDQKSPLLSSNDIYVAQTITAADTTTISTQQTSITNGSSNYPQNTSVRTLDQSTARTTIRELLAADVAKTEVRSRLYIKDALIALGNGNFTKESRRALSLFGSADITPEGSCMITLNSDILISGPNFLHPSDSFGYDTNSTTRCVPATPQFRRGHHEIIFYSPVERTITVASETELDLTAFAKGLVLNGQRITFAGKVKLVFEPNTRLRLPYNANNKRDYCVTLAFKDDAELIFEGIENYDISTWTDPLNGPDLVRSKLLGCGILEFSGNAKAKILKSALVGIEADYTSNITNIEIKLTDNSQWLIGTTTIAGGGLQIGNIQDGGSNNLDEGQYPNSTTHPRYGSLENPFVPRKTHIDFTLTLAGNNAQFYIGRGGFLGFGAGTVNKEGIMNGTETTNPWLLQSLYNTGNISLNLLRGTFWHQNIADGSSTEASLVAVGPQTGRTLYKLTMNKKPNTLIRGGGNVIFVRANYTTPQAISITNTIEPLIGDNTDSGKHSLLAPPPVIILRQEPDAEHPGYKKYGNAVIFETPTTYFLNGPSDDFFRAITLQDLSKNGRYAVAYKQESETKFTLIDGDGAIITNPIKLRQIKDQSNKRITPKNVISEGVIRSSTTTAYPQRLIKPKA